MKSINLAVLYSFHKNVIVTQQNQTRLLGATDNIISTDNEYQ